MENTQFLRSTKQHIRLHVLPTDRFKTFAISMYVGLPLQEEDVTPTALSAYVLRRGTATMPETYQIHEKRDHLYGAGFNLNVFKRGEYQIVNMAMDTIHNRFVGSAADDQNLLEESFKFLGELLTDPLVENGGFSSRYVDAEKNTLRNQIESIINNKTKYASERCVQEMCKDEPFRLHPLGHLEHIDPITPTSLYDHYQQWLKRAAIDIYVVGDTTLEEVEALISAHFKLDRSENVTYELPSIVNNVRQVNEIIEKMDVTQGKLNLGLRLPISYADDNYSAALVYNGILGSFSHSKLFMNVREKASLAYYAASNFEALKGILMIYSGIEIGQYDQAVSIIKEQLESIKQGEISEMEMSQTKAMLINNFMEVQDAAFSMISFDYSRVLAGYETTTTRMIEEVEQVSVEDVKQIAEQVQLDTVYFLRDQKGE